MVLLSQILVFILGVAAFWFASGKESYKRAIGATLGLAGQPFWFIITISSKQWFVMLLCCFYTFTWGRMLWNNVNHGSNSLSQKWYWFRWLWRSAAIKIWYYWILGRRRSIRKEEDCEFYVNKKHPGRQKAYECWGDGRYECKNCIHFTPEPETEE